MTLLVLDGAGPGVTALLEGHGSRTAPRAGAIACLAQALLHEAGMAPAQLEAVVAMVGPGSFTGLRAALAFAQGLAAGAECPLVPLAEAEALSVVHPGIALLAVFETGRSGRFALQRIAADGQVAPPLALDAAGLAALPVAPGTRLVGPAAAAAARVLSDADRPASLAEPARPPPAAIAAAARLRLAGRLPPRAALPLYADDLFGAAP